MSGPWNKYNLKWRLPDQPANGDGPHDEISNAQDDASEKKKNEENFSFELTRLKPSMNPKVQVNKQPEQSEDSQPESLPSLQVGKPGDFSSQSHDHGVRLPEGEPSPGTATKSGHIVMVDDPMPEIGGNGGAAVQEMFVAEVLKGVAGFGTRVHPSNGVQESDDDGQSSENSEQSLATSEKLFTNTMAIEPTIFLHTQPESPLVSELAVSKNSDLEVHSGQATDSQIYNQKSYDSEGYPSGFDQGSLNSSEEYESRSQGSVPIGDATRAALLARVMVAGANGKSALSPFEADGRVRKKEQLFKGGPGFSAFDTTSDENSSTGVKRSKGDGKFSVGVRVALGLFVLSIIFSASLIFFKNFDFFSDGGEIQPPEVEKPLAIRNKNPPPSKVKKDALKSPKKNLQVGGLTAKSNENTPIKNENSKTVYEKQKKTVAVSENLELTEALPKSSENREQKLTGKPISRFNLSNSEFGPMIEISVALDRVQPRKALNLLKNLSDDSLARDKLARSALRELTARYYLQVGAFSKALTLFRQVCTDPGQSSEVESCVHAARAFLLTNNVDEYKDITEALSARLIGQNSTWTPWIKLLEVVALLSEKNVDSFLQFTDQMTEMAPFMTSEWSAQISAFFAQRLVTAENDVQVAFLRSLNGVRRKSLEMKLTPTFDNLDSGSQMMASVINILLRHYDLTPLNLKIEEVETDSSSSLTSWILSILAHAQLNDQRQTRARLSPLFGVRAYAPLARVIEGHLAVQAGDFVGASAMIDEQIGQPFVNGQGKNISKDQFSNSKHNGFLASIDGFKDFPFLYVEWLYLGIKVAAGLNDKAMMRPLIYALAGSRQRFVELGRDFQYWSLLARGYRVLGMVSAVDEATKEAEKLSFTLHEKGFVSADKVWLLMKRGKRSEARALMRESLRNYPHHIRLLELGAEYAAQWSEDPLSYLKLEAEIPKRFESRGRDRALLSFFTISKLLEKLQIN